MYKDNDKIWDKWSCIGIRFLLYCASQYKSKVDSDKCRYIL